jgi:transcription initiation factor IIE alpha subunit
MKANMNFNLILQHMFPRARNNDPITSYEASDKVDFAGEHFDIILGCLTKHGPLGKDGIASRTNLDGNQVARRLSEMMRLDFIELTGNTVKSACNRNEREWRLKEKNESQL